MVCDRGMRDEILYNYFAARRCLTFVNRRNDDMPIRSIRRFKYQLPTKLYDFIDIPTAAYTFRLSSGLTCIQRCALGQYRYAGKQWRIYNNIYYCFASGVETIVTITEPLFFIFESVVLLELTCY